MIRTHLHINDKTALRFYFQVHISQSSTVADHCITYALSDPKERAFQSECAHHHNDGCDRCELVSSTLDSIEAAFVAQASTLQEEEKEELTFTLKNAKVNIFAWKAHILRFIHQDHARVDAIDILKDGETVFVQNWAMKYLPRKYRESQTNWFGKRGILWHITVAFRKFEGQLELLTFAHIFRSCNQDSSAVVAVMEDVICQLEVVMPNLTRVFYRQDNAGCYHCGATIDCASNSGSRNGVQVERLDFSDAQGGKGACDRKAATIKAHVF